MNFEDLSVPGHRKLPAGKVPGQKLPNLFHSGVQDLFSLFAGDPFESDHPNVDYVSPPETAPITRGEGCPDVEESVVSVVRCCTPGSPSGVQEIPIPKPILEVGVYLPKEMPKGNLELPRRMMLHITKLLPRQPVRPPQ